MLGDAPAVEPAAPAARQVAGLLVERGRAFPVLEDARLGPGRDTLAEPFDSGRDQRRLDELAREMVEVLEEQALARVGKTRSGSRRIRLIRRKWSRNPAGAAPPWMRSASWSAARRWAS